MSLRKRLAFLLPPNSLSIPTDLIEGLEPISENGDMNVFRLAWNDRAKHAADFRTLPTLSVKAIRISGPMEANKKLAMKRLREWTMLRHENVLELVGFIVLTPAFDFPCPVIPWMNNGNVMQYVSHHPDVEKVELLVGIGKGVQYLHEHDPPIIHGNIKANNVLMDERAIPHLTDFSLSSPSLDFALNPPSRSADRSIRWTAPELASRAHTVSTPQSDVYSFTMTCLEIMTGHVPFFYECQDDIEVKAALISGVKPEPPSEEVLHPYIWNEVLSPNLDSEPLNRKGMGEVVRKLRFYLDNKRVLGSGGESPMEERKNQQKKKKKKKKNQWDEEEEVGSHGGVWDDHPHPHPHPHPHGHGHTSTSTPTYETIESMHLRAKEYIKLGLYSEARELVEQLVKKGRQDLGDNHIDTIRFEYLLSLIYIETKHYDGCRELVERVVGKMGRVLPEGENGRETLAAMHLLADVEIELGAYDRAWALAEKVSMRRQIILGEKHEDTLASLYLLARALYELGYYEKSKTIAEKLVTDTMTIFHEWNPRTLASMDLLASVYFEEGEYEKALKLAGLVLERRMQFLGNESGMTRASRYFFAFVYFEMGRYGETRDVLGDVLKVRKGLLSTMSSSVPSSFRTRGSGLGGRGGKDPFWKRICSRTKRRKMEDRLEGLYLLCVENPEMDLCVESMELKERVVELGREVLGEEWVMWLHFVLGLLPSATSPWSLLSPPRSSSLKRKPRMRVRFLGW